MGFVAKSVFWLGLVYSAMPFDSGTPIALAPTPGAMPREASSSLESLAAAVIPAVSQNPDGWKSAVESRRGALRAQLPSRRGRRAELDRRSAGKRPGRPLVATGLAREIRPRGRCSTARG